MSEPIDLARLRELAEKRDGLAVIIEKPELRWLLDYIQRAEEVVKTGLRLMDLWYRKGIDDRETIRALTEFSDLAHALDASHPSRDRV